MSSVNSTEWSRTQLWHQLLPAGWIDSIRLGAVWVTLLYAYCARMLCNNIDSTLLPKAFMDLMFLGLFFRMTHIPFSFLDFCHGIVCGQTGIKQIQWISLLYIMFHGHFSGKEVGEAEYEQELKDWDSDYHYHRLFLAIYGHWTIRLMNCMGVLNIRRTSDQHVLKLTSIACQPTRLPIMFRQCPNQSGPRGSPCLWYQ